MRRAFVRVAPATLAIGVVTEASANPPPPKTLPDPPLTAPTKAESPHVVRTHGRLCYAFYPSGGTLAVECPTELLREPSGEALVKQPSGRCQFVPLTSGSPGRTGYIEKCPTMFEQVAEQGVIPEWSKKLAAERRASSGEPEPMPTPLPARLDNAQPQEVGCTGCATSPWEPSLAPIAAAGIAAVVSVRRRRRSK